MKEMNKTVRLLLGKAFVLALLLPLCSVASAVEVTDVPLNQTITVQTPSAPLSEAESPKKLWRYYGGGYAPNFYARIFRFTVSPGQKYTFYGYFPTDGEYRNAYLRGDNPLTDYTYSWGSTANLTTGFVFWGQQPWKGSCSAAVRRNNITISPKSEHNYLYVIAVSKKPGQSFQMLLKAPGDNDDEVAKNLEPPSCPQRKGSHWGTVWSNPFLLRYDPSEKQRTAGQPPATDPQKPPQPGTVPPGTVPPGQAGYTHPPGTVPPGQGGYPQPPSALPQGVCQWVEYVKSGKAFWVHFDATLNKFNDANFTGDWRTDPMGTLKGGEAYEVSFRDGKFTCTGYNQAGRRAETHSNSGVDPDDGLISLWGRTYAIDGKGQVWDPDYGFVGHLRLSK